MFYNNVPFAPDLCATVHPHSPAHLPPYLLRNFPCHRLRSVLSSLPDTMPGMNTPVAQTRYQNTPCLAGRPSEYWRVVCMAPTANIGRLLRTVSRWFMVSFVPLVSTYGARHRPRSSTFYRHASPPSALLRVASPRRQRPRTCRPHGELCHVGALLRQDPLALRFRACRATFYCIISVL